MLKKPDLDLADVRSFRPISNLPVASKLLERLVATPLKAYLNTTDLLPSLQSAYRVIHSTETMQLKVFGDVLLALNRGNFAALKLLDLLAAFDAVDHATLLWRLEVTYSRRGWVPRWFTSYLSYRWQFARSGNTSSSQIWRATGHSR
jgi:hypothetical protein